MTISSQRSPFFWFLLALGACNRSPSNQNPLGQHPAGKAAETENCELVEQLSRGNQKNASCCAVQTEVHPPISQIAFIDIENPCPCKSEIIQATWQVLQEVLAQQPSLKVERIHADADIGKHRSAVLLGDQTLDVLPGLLFMDNNGKVIHTLQGQLSKDQILTALAAAP